LRGSVAAGRVQSDRETAMSGKFEISKDKASQVPVPPQSSQR
jgi:hypothetical protein